MGTVDLSRHIFDMGNQMNRTRASEIRTISPVHEYKTTMPEPLREVHAVFLGDRLLGLYRKEEAAIVTAHRIRLSDVYAGLTWEKTTHAYSGKQVWTCDVHGETITLTIEPRRVE